MNIFFIILILSFGIIIFLETIFSQKGKYMTQSYKINPYIDKHENIELIVCDAYLKKKSFLVNYKYQKYLETKQTIVVSFVKIPIIMKKPYIINVYINNEKINVE